MSKGISNLMKEFHEEEEKIVPITKLNPVGKDTDWLATIPVGTTFLTSHYGSLQEYTLQGRHKTVRVTLLTKNYREGKEDKSIWLWYNNYNFCKDNSFIAIVS